MADTGLTQLVDQLTAPHPHVEVVRGNPVEGTELPLLQQLHDAVGSTTTADGGKGGGGTPSVIDADALALWASIREQIITGATTASPAARGMPDHGKAHELTRTMTLLRLWARAVTARGAAMADQVNLYVKALTWVEDIRAHFNPEKRVPLRGVECPTCHVKTLKVGTERGPIIVLHYTRPAPVALCRGCGSTWTGGQLLDLRAGKPAEQQPAPAK